MQWRKQKLWNLEINDLLEGNKKSLMTIYKSVFNERKQYMNKQDALELMYTHLAVNDKDAL